MDAPEISLVEGKVPALPGTDIKFNCSVKDYSPKLNISIDWLDHDTGNVLQSGLIGTEYVMKNVTIKSAMKLKCRAQGLFNDIKYVEKNSTFVDVAIDGKF